MFFEFRQFDQEPNLLIYRITFLIFINISHEKIITII